MSKSEQLRTIRQQVSVADRVLLGGPDAAGPAEWAKVAADAAKVLHVHAGLARARARLGTSGPGVGVPGSHVAYEPSTGPSIDL